MTEVAVWATMEALPGREAEAQSFLQESARRIREEEPGTLAFFALELGGGRFAVFNAFADEAAFVAHRDGPVATWVRASSPGIFVGPYITRARVIADKL